MKHQAARFALYMFVLPGLTLAQTTAVIEGMVLDPAGLPVSRCAVALVETGTGSTRTTRTDGQGWYVAPGLVPGIYRVSVTAPGFHVAEQLQVPLSAGRTVRIDFRLELGEVFEKVTVTGSAAMVSTSASDWGGAIDRQQLDSLPLNGRDVFDLAAQQPGVSVANHSEGAVFNGLGIQISVNGNRPNQNSFRMDGVYLNDGAASAPASAAGRLLGVEGIEELRLITNPFSAEFGKAAGAVLTAVSKSGTNSFHGTVYHYLRNSALDARNFFDSPSEPIPPLRRNQFGGVLSGPVRANRIFFLVNYEGVRESSSRTRRAVTLNENARRGLLPGVQVTVNPAVVPYLDLYPKPNGRDFGDGTAEFVSLGTTTSREDFGAARGDVVLSERLRTSVHLTADGAENASPDPFLMWNLQKFSRFLFVHSETNFVQSDRTLHSFRFGYSHVRNNEDAAPPDVPASLSFVAGRPVGQIQVTGLTDITDRTVGGLPRFQVLDDTQFNYQMSCVRGAHAVRFGAGYDRLGFQQRADFNANGRYVFSSLQNLLRGIARSGDLMSPESDTNRRWRQHQYYFFSQDEIRVNSRLNLSLGVRYEGYTSPAEQDHKIATLRNLLRDKELRIGGPLFDNPSAKNFAPRAALAWSPFQSNRTVIRAGAGMFFDLLTSREVTVAGMRVPPFFNRIFLTAPPFPGLFAASQAGTTDKSLDGLAYYLRQPYVLQFRFAVERQMGEHTAIEAGYSGSRGVHLVGQYGDFNVSQPQLLAGGRPFFTQGGAFRNPAFGRIGLRSSDFDSVYHALVVQVRRRFASGVAFQASYTWAKTIDNSSSSTNTDFDNSDRNPFPLDIRLQRGLSDFDVRHLLNLNAVWEIPWRTSGWSNHILGGWELNGLVQVQSGFPFNPRIGFDRTRLQSGFGDLDQRPSLSASPPEHLILGDPSRYFDPAAFVLPDVGFYGNLGRNTLIGPGLFSLNLGLHKVLWHSGRHQVRLRVDAFNATNHPNFDAPAALSLFASTGGRVGSAGQITTTSTAARQMQLSLRWAF